VTGIGQSSGTRRGHGHDSGDEGLEVESLLVQDSLRLGICGVVQLETTIKQKSVYLIGADPPADIV
jgi:hypothetical protein